MNKKIRKKRIILNSFLKHVNKFLIKKKLIYNKIIDNNIYIIIK